MIINSVYRTMSFQREISSLSGKSEDLCNNIVRIIIRIKGLADKYIYTKKSDELKKYEEDIIKLRKELIETHNKLAGLLIKNGQSKQTEKEINIIKGRMNLFFHHIDMLFTADQLEEKLAEGYKSTKIFRDLDTSSYSVIVAVAMIKLSI